MKSSLLYLSLCAGVFALAGTNAAARPLQRADVAANPVWIVHVDCDLLRATALGEYLRTELERPEAQARLAAFQALSSVDLRTQLHGLTLYGLGTSPQDGVLLVYADFDSSRLITLAKAARDAQETQYKQNTIYSWIDDHKKAKDGAKPRTYAAVLGSRVIFAQREERVGQALDVLTGAAPNLASSEVFAQLGVVGNTSFIQAAARKLDFGASDPHAAILRLSKLVRFQLGETRQQVTATLNLEANNEEVATNMASIAQGLVALMKLQREKPEAVKIAEALVLKHEGTGLSVNLTLPAGDVIEMMKAGAARKAQKQSERENK